jgi:hypothetical protein
MPRLGDGVVSQDRQQTVRAHSRRKASVLSAGGSRPWQSSSSRVFPSKVWPKAAEFWNDI